MLHVLLTRCPKSKFDATGDHPQNRDMATEALIPTTPEEAAGLFGDGSSDLTVFAGGTILLPEIASGRLRPTRALMLHRSGLDTLDTSGDVVRIGATTTIAALIEGTDDLLTRFAEHVGDREVRRTATVGGNLCASPGIGAQRGDLGAPLIALGARVTLDRQGRRAHGARRRLPLRRPCGPARALDRVRPPGRQDRGGDDAPPSRALLRRRERRGRRAGGGIRVGISGVGPFAVRARSVEQSRNAADVLNDVEPVGDALASAAYRRKMLPLLVQRALDQLESA